MKYRLTEAAARDIRDILRETLKTFGPRQVMAYRAIIEAGLEAIAEQPDRPGSLDRADIPPGIRSWHLALATGRRGGAAHCLYYMMGRLPDGSAGVIIARILHEHMEPRYKVVRSLKAM